MEDSRRKAIEDRMNQFCRDMKNFQGAGCKFTGDIAYNLDDNGSISLSYIIAGVNNGECSDIAKFKELINNSLNATISDLIEYQQATELYPVYPWYTFGMFGLGLRGLPFIK